MHTLDNLSKIKEIDQAGMAETLAGFPEQCKQAFKLGKDFSVSADLADAKNIVFCGMGGSAIGAEIICAYLRKEIEVAIHVNRDYTIPRFVNRECLVILNSYSGNTEETLSAYQEAQKRQAKIIVLTSGGQLANFAGRDGHPVLLIPTGFPPRAALAFLAFPVLAIFSQLGLIADKEKEIEETISILAEMEKHSLGLEVPAKSNPAKNLAQRIFDHFCVIYGASDHLVSVVTRWRGQLAENSKSLSSSHVLPEMNHNEIVGWQHPQKLLKKCVVVLLRDKEDHPQVKKRIEISKEILQKGAAAVEEIYSQGEGLLARTFSLIYLGDFTSLYLAVLNQEDPTPVKRIDYLKKRLKEWQ